MSIETMLIGMEEIKKRILTWMNEGKVGPARLQLNLTNRCNIKCRFCWLRDFDSTGANYDEIGPERYLEIIDEASDIGVKSVEITGGGEPLCREDILDIMKKVKENGLYGELITNGTLVTAELANEIVDMNWNKVVFSLDAPDADTNDHLRGMNGVFEKTVQTIKLLNSIKGEHKRDKPEICVHMVLCNKNHDKIAEMFEFVHELGCDNLFIEPIVLLALETGAGKDLMFKDEHKKQLLLEIEKAKDIARKHHFKTNLDKLKFQFIEKVNKMDETIMEEAGDVKIEAGKDFLSIPCYYPWYQMIIRPWGVAGPCCMFDNIGDDVKEKNLKEIWYGKHFEKIREKLRSGTLPDFCFKCNPGQVQENIKIRQVLRKRGK